MSGPTRHALGLDLETRPNADRFEFVRDDLIQL